MFSNRARAYPKKPLSDAPLKGRHLASPTKHKTRLERLDRDKHASLLQKLMNKSFITLRPVVNVIKLFTIISYDFS
jgi:hypothetical protein